YSSSLWRTSVWWDVAWLACVLIPAVFALVYLALPVWRRRWVLPAALAAAGIAALLEALGLHAAADFGKLAGATLLAFWFVGYFETAQWVALLALIVPWVDAYSVWRGPTGSIVKD